MNSKFSYFGPGPDYEWFDFTLHGQIRSVSPNNGSVGGGQVITVTGDGFNDNSVVTIGQERVIKKTYLVINERFFLYFV